MKLQAFSDLEQLLSEEERKKRGTELSAKKPVHDGKEKSVRVALETAGRKGKIVTVVYNLRHNPSALEEIATTLKRYCGAGGTVKNGTIEIQGDQRVRVIAKLREMNYRAE